MQNERKRDDTINELMRVARELSTLIEDNNQNIKDCYSTLKRIEGVLCPPKKNVLLRVVGKILNRCMRL